jgi:MFS family permease
LAIAWGVSAFFTGNLSDRFGRRKVLVPALIVFSLLSGLSGVATGFLSMLLVRAGMGLAEGAYCPTSFASVAEASKPTRRGFNQGLQQSMFALFGLGFGPIIATQLLQSMSWRWVFAVVGIPGLIVAVLVARTIREPRTIAGTAARAASPAHTTSIREIMRHRNVPLGMLGLMCSMCGIFVLGGFGPQYLTGALHLTDQQMGFVVSAIGFGGFIGQWWLCALSDIFGRRTMAITGFGVGALFLWFFMQAGSSNLLLLFALLFVSSAFAFGLLSLITGPVATEAAPLGLIATTGGIIIGVGEVFGGGIGPVIGGYVARHFGVAYTMWIAFGGLIAGLIVSLFIKETAPRRVGHGTNLSQLDHLEEVEKSAVV